MPRLPKFEEKAPRFSAGMNPTTGRQPPELSPRTSYLAVSTTGKNWRLDWGPPGRRRPPHRSRKGVSEAVETRQTKSDSRSIVPAHCGTKGRQADGTARARTRGNPRPGASPPSLRDKRDTRCKRIPRPNGRRIRHTPRGADVSRTHPVSPRRTPFGRREVANEDTGTPRCPTLEPSRFSAGRMSSVARCCAVSVDGHGSIFHRDRLVSSSNGADKMENVLVRGFDDECLDTS